MAFEWGRFSEKALRSFIEPPTRLNIYDGAVSSSKTISSLVAWLREVRTGPRGALLMVGRTERTLERNILDPLTEIVGVKRLRQHRGLGTVELCGRRIYIAGANDLRSEGKIRGLTLAGAYGDELTLWPESFFRMLLSRLRVRGAKFYGTTNPDSPYHYLKTHFLDRIGELDLKRWHFELSDNPNLDPAYVEALKREYTGLWYKRFILGLWVLAEGSIYDMWVDEKGPDGNLFDDSEVPESLAWTARRCIGIDYGTTNPMVFGDWRDDGRTLWRVNEYYWDSRATGRQKTDSQYADDLDAFIAGPDGNGPRPVAVILDPSAASFRAELVARNYIVVDANNEVLDGIRVMATAINRRLVRVHERCEHFRREIAGYVWDDKARLHGKEQPLKTNDHVMDESRYLVRTILQPWRLAAA